MTMEDLEDPSEEFPYASYKSLLKKTDDLQRKFNDLQRDAQALIREWDQAIHTLQPIFRAINLAMEHANDPSNVLQ